MKKASKKKLEEVLDIVNDELEDFGKELIKLPSDPIEIITPAQVTEALVESNDKSLDENPLNEDIDTARASLHNLLDKATEAVDSLLEVCAEGSQPRSYEVAGQLMKVAGDLAKDLVALHRMKAEINKIKLPGESTNTPHTFQESITTPTPGTTQIIFNGTNAELLQAIKKGRAAAPEAAEEEDK